MVRIIKRPKVKFKEIKSKIKIISSNGKDIERGHEDLEEFVSERDRSVGGRGEAPSLRTGAIMSADGETPIPSRVVERALPREATYMSSNSSNPYAPSPGTGMVYDARERTSQDTSRINRPPVLLPENVSHVFDSQSVSQRAPLRQDMQRDDRYSSTPKGEGKKEKRYAWEV